MYRYIQIGSDARFSLSLERERIINTLRSFSEIEEDKRHGFKNSGDTPWLRINIAMCDADGNYPGKSSADSDQANMVELICLDKGDSRAQDFYESLASRISKALDWKLNFQDHQTGAESPESLVKSIEGHANIARLFSLFHDGCIDRHKIGDGNVTFYINILYLAQMVAPEMIGFKVSLEVSKPIKFVTWPDHETQESKTLTDLNLIIATELQILEAKTQGEMIAVSCAQTASQTGDIGGELMIAAQKAQVSDENNTVYALETLETIAKTYWDEWSKT